MASVRLKPYYPLITFLAKTLGPDYEIALHDYSTKGSSLVALENGHISGRHLGAPLNTRCLEAIYSEEYRNCHFITDYTTRSAEGKMLRSCSFFIKDDQAELIGLLCINFNDARHQNLIQDILRLCHPDNFVEQKYIYKDQHTIPEASAEELENLHSSVSEAIEDRIRKIVLSKGIPVERLTADEKMEIVKEMYDKGIFILKGSVKEVSIHLKCSQTSVYRYVNNLKKTGTPLS